MERDWLDSVEGPRTRRGLDEAKRRLMRLGAHALSGPELVAVLLGLDDERAAVGLLGDGLRALLSDSPEGLQEHRGLDDTQATRLLAAAELARRLPRAHEERPRLSTPTAIYAWVKAHFVGLRREEFHVLCLSTRNTLLRHARVAEGSVDQCVVDPREVLAPAVACRATGLVLLHNHPSGDPEPSVHDVALTRQLREGARLLNVKVVDHLVLGDRGYVSLLARGLMRGDDAPALQRLQSP